MAADDQNNRIRIATNLPDLKNKIQTNITGNTDNIYWYIRFNIPLDESSVSEKTMSVTDTDGYIMRTDITYDTSKNMIIISPLDTYEQEVFYLLQISKKVKSRRGNKLKSQMCILFKLKGNQITEFKTLKSNVQIPKTKKRPPNYDTMFRENIKTASRVYSFDDTPFKEAGPDKLPTADVKINMWLGVIGLAIIIIFAFTKVLALLIIGLPICVTGIVHISIQMSKRELRSIIAYNKGVRKFNKEKYNEAGLNFKKAILLNPSNEMAEYAANKMTFYD